MFQPQPIYFSDFPYGATSQPPLPQNQYSYAQIPSQQPQQQQLRQPTNHNRAGPISFSAPNFASAPTGLWGNIGQSEPQPQIPQRPFQRQQQQQYSITSRDIVPKMEEAVDDYAAQQALAGGYAPKLEGPLVGEKKSSHAITEEYAKADPVYVEKTRRLPQTYSYFRPVQGDGNCGWRAIGFSYFECLVKLWSSDTVDAELGRLMSLSTSITSFGIMEEYMLEDFRDPMTNLLNDLSSHITSNSSSPEAAIGLVRSRFNDAAGEGNHILYYLRCITAAHLLGNATAYEPFLDQDMDSYCKQTLLGMDTEIDSLGLTLLIEALIKPAGFAVEIVVLERSAGDEVNTHQYNLDLNGNPMPANAPTAYILYKPGHYDILYKGTSNAVNQQRVMNAAAAAQNVQVNRAALPTRQLDPSPMSSMSYGSTMDMGLLSSIPGMSMGAFNGFQQSYTPMSTSFAPSPAAYTPAPSSFAPLPYGIDTSMSMMGSAPIKSISPSPMSVASTLASIPPMPSRQARTPPSNNFPPSQYSGSTLPSHPGTRNNSIATESSLLSPNGGLTPTTPQIIAQLSSLGVNSNDQFRQSRYVFERPTEGVREGGGGWGGKEGEGGQTRQFRESHHNEAHYDNKNFQPYIWSPGEEGEDDGTGGGGGGTGGGKKGKGRGRRAS